jgi:hypothetical protein
VYGGVILLQHANETMHCFYKKDNALRFVNICSFLFLCDLEEFVE